MKQINVFLIDNNKNFLSTAIRFLKSDPKINIMGSCLSGEDGIESIKKNKPDLVLMDLSMPGIGGFKATKIIKQFENPPRIIILTLHDNLEYRNEATMAGADAFISKSDFGTDLFPKINELFVDFSEVD